MTSSVASALDAPPLSGRVNDHAGLLDEFTEKRVESLLSLHESATTNQVVVLTVETLGDLDIETYAVNVFEAWKLGQAGIDNGVLILIAETERSVRIEVGYGLEGTLTDLQSARIINNVMIPHFREGRYDLGIESGARDIVAFLKGETTTVAKQTPAIDSAKVKRRWSLGHIAGAALMLLFAYILFNYAYLKYWYFTIFGGGWGWAAYGLPLIVVLGGTIVFVYDPEEPLTYVMVTFPAWFIVIATPYLRHVRSAERPAWALAWVERLKKAEQELTSEGGGSGGSSRGGSSSGGGYSGGGGRSGGGGASGGW